MKFLIRTVLKIFPRRYLIILSYAFTRFSSLFYRGNKYECPVCDGRFRKMLPYGYIDLRNNALCPSCLSLERHRLLWLYLKNKTNFFSDTLKVLHIAPEQCYLKRFRKLTNLDYTTGDLESPIADVKMDVINIPFDVNQFDVVLCNHVLEHIERLDKALSEIYRILKPGGFAILLVPVDFNREVTYEDLTITDPKEREKHFFQYDHVRLFGRDYPEIIKKAGFVVNEQNYINELPGDVKEKYCLPENEFMFAFRK
jgi:SAM-dependent methyltransferase